MQTKSLLSPLAQLWPSWDRVPEPQPAGSAPLEAGEESTLSTVEPEAMPDASVNYERRSSDAEAFGIAVANAVQTELEAAASEERLQAIQEVFIQAVEHIEKRYGLITATTWMEEANKAMRRGFAELNNVPSFQSGL